MKIQVASGTHCDGFNEDDVIECPMQNVGLEAGEMVAVCLRYGAIIHENERCLPCLDDYPGSIEIEWPDPRPKVT
ncbi:MAG: hypothetical protein HZA03_00935 [Nitrospinae bacterium]|nr:hypothetical protein [Nitrospinota bacterium]